MEKEDLIELSKDEFDTIDKKEVEYQITMFEQRLRQMTPNMAAIEEYRKKVNLDIYMYFFLIEHWVEHANVIIFTPHVDHPPY